MSETPLLWAKRSRTGFSEFYFHYDRLYGKVSISNDAIVVETNESPSIMSRYLRTYPSVISSTLTIGYDHTVYVVIKCL